MNLFVIYIFLSFYWNHLNSSRCRRETAACKSVQFYSSWIIKFTNDQMDPNWIKTNSAKMHCRWRYAWLKVSRIKLSGSDQSLRFIIIKKIPHFDSQFIFFFFTFTDTLQPNQQDKCYVQTDPFFMFQLLLYFSVTTQFMLCLSLATNITWWRWAKQHVWLKIPVLVAKITDRNGCKHPKVSLEISTDKHIMWTWYSTFAAKVNRGRICGSRNRNG